MLIAVSLRTNAVVIRHIVGLLQEVEFVTSQADRQGGAMLIVEPNRLTLRDMAEASDWVRRPMPGSNHTIWIAEHQAVSTNALIGWVKPSRKTDLGGYADLFGQGSKPLDHQTAYLIPPK